MSIVTGVMTVSDMMSASALVAHARRVKALGYGSMWITDMFGREIYVTAGHLLANTSTIAVGTAIAHIYGRDHVESVQAARTLSELSGGRFLQGIGVSRTRVDAFREAGVTRVVLAASPAAGSGSEWELIEALAPPR